MVITWNEAGVDALEDEALRILEAAGWGTDEPVAQTFERLAPDELDALNRLLDELGPPSRG